MIMIMILLVAIVFIYVMFPSYTKKKHQHYDVCIVLGSPSHDDGSITRMQKTRMDKAIQLYRVKYVNHIMISGGAVRNRYTEAEIMGKYAISQGIPKQVLFLEEQAQNTFDNLRYAKKMCDQNHFHTIIVVTSNFHVRRAGFFVRKFFSDFAMAGTDDKEKIKHYISEYFRMWNTLRIEILLKFKNKI